METKKRRRSKLPSLPEDIIIDILTKLSVRSIVRFRCVCKRWYELFKNPKFIKSHLQHAIQNYKFSVLLASNTGESYTIDFDVTSSSYHMAVKTNLPRNMSLHGSLPVVTCDGLIGLSNYFRDEDTILWNPSTREYKNISSVSYMNQYRTCDAFTRYGVCYDWKIHDYKLFKIVLTGCKKKSVVWVRQLSSSSWTCIGNVPYNISLANISKKPLRGIIHWIGNTKVIVAIDIIAKQIKEIQIPSCYVDDEFNEFRSFHRMEVDVLGEDLYLSVGGIYCNGNNIDLWVIKDYGVVDSWTRIFSLSKDEIFYDSLRPLHYLNNGCEILLQGVRVQQHNFGGETTLVSYNLKNRGLTTLDIRGVPEYFCATTFVGSLVSLDTGESVEATKVSKKP